MKEAFFDLFWEIVADFKDALPYLCRLVVAAVCGAGIGLERTLRQKEAGLRTHIIVALGSALMMIVSKYGFFDLFMYDNVKFDGSRLAANIITGVSFLGSGIIIYKGSIKGLTTAAGIWATAGIGLAIGAGMYGIGVYATIVLLLIQIFIHKFVPIENTVATSVKLKIKNDPVALDHVEEILHKKGVDIMTTDIISISADDRLVHARKVIMDSGVGRLLLTEDNELAGIITSKDIAKAFVPFRKHTPDKYQSSQIKELIAGDYMSTNVETISQYASIPQLADAMLETGYNGYPVVDDEDQIIGIVTQSDLLKLIYEMETQ